MNKFFVLVNMSEPQVLMKTVPTSAWSEIVIFSRLTRQPTAIFLKSGRSSQLKFPDS